MASTVDIADAITRARSDWPEFELDAGAFAATCEALRTDAEHVSELYLVRACVEGHERAIEQFKTMSEPVIRQAARSLVRNEADREELVQLTLVRLLVGEKPRVVEYHGRGSLAGWLKAVTTRLGLNELRHRERLERREEPVGTLPDLTLDRDPTLLVFRANHRVDFDAALKTGWSQLTSQQRTLLQMSILDGLSIDRIGAVYGKHRTTAFRWVEQARLDLLEFTRAALAERLSLSRDELASLLRSLGSQLDVSIRSIMRPAP